MIEFCCKNNKTGEIYTKKYLSCDEAKGFLEFTCLNKGITVLKITQSQYSSCFGVVRKEISI